MGGDGLTPSISDNQRTGGATLFWDVLYKTECLRIPRPPLTGPLFSHSAGIQLLTAVLLAWTPDGVLCHLQQRLDPNTLWTRQVTYVREAMDQLTPQQEAAAETGQVQALT